MLPIHFLHFFKYFCKKVVYVFLCKNYELSVALFFFFLLWIEKYSKRIFTHNKAQLLLSLLLYHEKEDFFYQFTLYIYTRCVINQTIPNVISTHHSPLLSWSFRGETLRILHIQRPRDYWNLCKYFYKNFLHMNRICACAPNKYIFLFSYNIDDNNEKKVVGDSYVKVSYMRKACFYSKFLIKSIKYTIFSHFFLQTMKRKYLTKSIFSIFWYEIFLSFFFFE